MAVIGTNVKLPTAIGIPLGFIVSELITNSAKYAKAASRCAVCSGAMVLRLVEANPSDGAMELRTYE